jgi:hypothetical protein
MFFLQADEYLEVEAYETQTLIQALRTPTVSENVLDDLMQATFEYYQRGSTRFGVGTDYTICVPRTPGSTISCRHCIGVIPLKRRTRFAIACLRT